MSQAWCYHTVVTLRHTSQRFSSASFESNRPELLFVLLVCSYRKDLHKGPFGALLMVFFCFGGHKSRPCVVLIKKLLWMNFVLIIKDEVGGRGQSGQVCLCAVWWRQVCVGGGLWLCSVILVVETLFVHPDSLFISCLVLWVSAVGLLSSLMEPDGTSPVELKEAITNIC